MLAIGMKMIMIEKYESDAICPIVVNGYSTGCPPIHVRIRRLAIKIQ